MEIAAIDHMIKEGVEFDLHIYVTMTKKGRDVNGNLISHYSAKIHRVNAGSIELAVSGRTRKQCGYITGRHSHAEYQLHNLGYDLAFVGLTKNGVAKYKIKNLMPLKKFDFSQWDLMAFDDTAPAYIKVIGCSRTKIDVPYASAIKFYVVAHHVESDVTINIDVDNTELYQALFYAQQLSTVFNVPWYVSDKLRG